MADRPKTKPANQQGKKNENRRNGKAWKQGKSPEVRAAEEKVKRQAKADRKAARKAAQ